MDVTDTYLMQQELLSAINNSQYERVKILLDNGVNPNFEIFNDISNVLPIFNAVLKRDKKMIKILLTHNLNNRVDPNIIRHGSYSNQTILHLCSSIYDGRNDISLKMMKLLLDSNANPNLGLISLNNNISPLSYLIMHNKSEEKIKLLLKYGATPTIINLINAIQHNNYNVVKLLLNYNIDPYEKVKGKNAFDYVTCKKMQFLLEENVFLNKWLKKIRNLEEGIIFAIKFHPDNFNVWKESLDPNNSLIKHW